jgi:hypothetical protein
MLHPTTLTSVAWPVHQDARPLSHSPQKIGTAKYAKMLDQLQCITWSKTWKLKLHIECRLQKCMDNKRVEINFLY